MSKQHHMSRTPEHRAWVALSAGATMGKEGKVSEFKEYLGDSVYADYDGFHIVLTAENGFGPSNTIALEPNVIAALINYNTILPTIVAEAERQKRYKEQVQNNENPGR